MARARAIWTRYRWWRRRHPLHRNPAAWAVAAALAVGGAVIYLVIPSDYSWWIGTAMTAPLVFLVGERGSRFRHDPRDAALSDGPWTSP